MIDLIFDCAILFGIILIYVKLRGRMDKMEQVMNSLYLSTASKIDLNGSLIMTSRNTIKEVKELVEPLNHAVARKILYESKPDRIEPAHVNPDGSVQMGMVGPESAKKKRPTRTTKKKNNSSI